MKRAILAAACVLLCAGCIRHEFEFHYISLEKIEGICIKSLGRLNRSDIKEDHDMPMRYELRREDYLLVFEVASHHWPSLLVSPRSPSGDDLAIEPITTGSCGSFRSISYRAQIDGMKAWSYVWIPPGNRNCPVRGKESYPPHQVIGFRVKSKEGHILGEERLPFDLVRNGFHYQIDSI